MTADGLQHCQDIQELLPRRCDDDHPYAFLTPVITLQVPRIQQGDLADESLRVGRRKTPHLPLRMNDRYSSVTE